MKNRMVLLNLIALASLIINSAYAITSHEKHILAGAISGAVVSGSLRLIAEAHNERPGTFKAFINDLTTTASLGALCGGVLARNANNLRSAIDEPGIIVTMLYLSLSTMAGHIMQR